MTYRGLWIVFASLALALVPFSSAPKMLAIPLMVAGIAGTWVGGVIYFKDMYRDLQRYVRERDEFERKLRER